MNNLYMPTVGKVVAIEPETPNTRTLTISLGKGRGFNCRPGQFVEFTVFGHGEFPVSVADNAGPEEGTFKVTIREIGKVTREVARLSVGSEVGIRGPFGNGYPLEQLQDRNVLVVSGGVGLAAVWLLLKHLTEQKDGHGQVRLLHGARTPEDIIYKDALLGEKADADARGFAAGLSVDRSGNGWSGPVGPVTDLLADPLPDPEDWVAVICGPGVMMKAVTTRLAELGLGEDRMFVSMERRMQCGMGACGHCMVGWKRVCLDGPVFPLDAIKNVRESGF